MWISDFHLHLFRTRVPDGATLCLALSSKRGCPDPNRIQHLTLLTASQVTQDQQTSPNVLEREEIDPLQLLQAPKQMNKGNSASCIQQSPKHTHKPSLPPSISISSHFRLVPAGSYTPEASLSRVPEIKHLNTGQICLGHQLIFLLPHPTPCHPWIFFTWETFIACMSAIR